MNTFAKYFEVVHVKCTDHVRTTASHNLNANFALPARAKIFDTV